MADTPGATPGKSTPTEAGTQPVRAAVAARPTPGIRPATSAVRTPPPGATVAPARPVAAAATPVTPAQQTATAIQKPSFEIVQQGQLDPWLKALFYGAYGVGKTVLSASADDVATMRDVIFVDAEAGYMSLSDRPWLDRVRITQYRQLARVYEFLKMHCRFRDADDVEKMRQLESRFRGGAEVEDPKRYKTVVIDSLSEVNKFCMYQLLGITVGDRPLDIETDTPEFKEWGQAAEMTRLLVRSFRDLPMNVIFVCSELVVDNDKKEQFRKPNLPGKLAGEIQAFYDVVGYYYAVTKEGEEETVRRLYISPGRTYDAKNRFVGNTKRYIDNPTLASILELRHAALASPA